MPHHLIRLPILQLLKPLHQPNNHIPGLRQRKLLAQTDPRPPIKGQELPADFLALPALGAVFGGVGSPDLGPPVHHVHGVVDFLVRADVDRRETVGPAAAGEGGVAGGAPGVHGDGGVEAEDFVEGVLEVGAAF